MLVNYSSFKASFQSLSYLIATTLGNLSVTGALNAYEAISSAPFT